MPHIAYRDYSPKPATARLIRMANNILNSPEHRGTSLTLRQLHYQFVSQHPDVYPNTMRSYNRLKGIVSNARDGGLLDWSHIEDRGRTFYGGSEWGSDNTDEVFQNLDRRYIRAAWENQPNYVEVWVEKDALGSVIERATARRGVGHIACKGYMSASEMWAAAQRIAGKMEAGRKVTVLHLGDHDPSGIDMTRDIEDRLGLYMTNNGDAVGVWNDAVNDGVDMKSEDSPFRVKRVALNMDQIEEYDPPPNPAKLSDSRAKDYVYEYGYESWELDALPPSVLIDLVQSEVDDLVDFDAWAESRRRQREGREQIREFSDLIPDLLTIDRDRLREFIDASESR